MQLYLLAANATVAWHGPFGEAVGHNFPSILKLMLLFSTQFLCLPTEEKVDELSKSPSVVVALMCQHKGMLIGIFVSSYESVE